MSLLHRWMLRKLGITQTHPVTIQLNHQVRTPDGVDLVTDLYLGEPKGAPVILIRSPYGRSVTLAAGMAYPLAARGYNVVLQSSRGTFGSTGIFDPHHDERRDGLTAIEWIKQQPWYGGAIGTFGPSYLGYTQWAVAADAGPEVKAMAMQVTLSDFSLMTYIGDSFSLENALTWTTMTNLMKSKRGLLKLVLSRILRRPMITAEQWRMLPIASLDEKVIGHRVKFWQDWVIHDSAKDPWWAPMSFRSSIPRIRRPISMAAGWHDIFLPMQLQDFTELRKAGIDSRITIGAWRHQDPELARTGIHDAIEWFDHHLRGKPLPSRSAVRLFVIGADEWREFDQWPPRESVAEHWYLQPQKALSRQKSHDSTPDRYRYDPSNPTPSLGGPALDLTPFSVDNTELEARADVLAYTSETFAQDRDLIGPVIADLYVASDAASADFFVRLCDVDASGRSMNICDGVQRVKIASPGVPQRLSVELWATAYRFAAGHRIRVQISSGAFPRFSRNLGGTEPLAAATQPRIAAQSIFHSPDLPSAIVLPFVAR